LLSVAVGFLYGRNRGNGHTGLPELMAMGICAKPLDAKSRETSAIHLEQDLIFSEIILIPPHERCLCRQYS
jgi:hypothetical protein